MAECAIARCVQERRSFKRELQKWGKNVLFLAGLERVAEELVGQEKWRRLMNPVADIESKVVVDWEPDDICWFCHSRKQLPPDLAKGVCPIDSLGIISELNESDGNLSESVYYNSPLLPWYFRDTNPSPSPQSDEPLDLSMGSKSACACPSPNSPYTDNDASTTVLKVPQIPLKSGMKKRFEASGCKRSYTEDELQAALRDIQSGKLGTRRAAVIYGIPRSTLRNKVYKLALERDSGDNVNNNNNKKEKCTSSSSPSTGLSMDDLVRCNGVLDSSNNSSTATAAPPSTTSASESLRQLLRNRLAEKSVVEDEGTTTTTTTTATQQQLDYNNTLGPLLSQVLANVHELALSKLRSGSAITNAMMKSSTDDEMCLPLLPDLIRRLAEERFEEETKLSNCNKNNLECETQTATSPTKNNVILKIPSYKPMKSVNEGTPSSASHSQTNSGHHNAAGKGIGVSLREIIAKSISQRAAVVNRRSPSMSAATSLLLSPPMTELLNGSSDSSNQDEPPSKKWKTSTSQKNTTTTNNNNNNNSATNNNNNMNNNNNADNKSEKRTRPKRGRYRNYDRDNLAEAVRAVQRGEMSVHRAGSYYGVPHSTLEYKVKERHLLRPRKRELKNNTNSCHGSKSKVKDETKNNSTQNGIKTSEESEKLSQGSLGNLNFPGHIPIWQSSPFFSLDFSQFSPNHFFASQMMRKLQEDALMHAENSSGGGKDSVSLLNSIIRSSVQSDTNLDLTVNRDEEDENDEGLVKSEDNAARVDD